MRNKSINTVSVAFSQNINRSFLKKFCHIMLQNQTRPTGSSRPNEPHWFIGSKWRLLRHLVSISWNVQWKNFGSNPLLNLYQNFMHWTSNISLTLSNFGYLNKGSVCALYLLKVIIRMDSFCNLIIPLVSKPQQVIPNCKWVRSIFHPCNNLEWYSWRGRFACSSVGY